MVYRMVVVENMSNNEIELRLCEHLAPHGFYNSIIRLPPFGRCEFPAAEFCNRNRDSRRPAAIVPFVDDMESPAHCRHLMPQEFLQYVKLLFYVDSKGGLTIKGIQPRFSDFGRFWGLGFLGRGYEGRREEIIISSTTCKL